MKDAKIWRKWRIRMNLFSTDLEYSEFLCDDESTSPIESYSNRTSYSSCFGRKDFWHNNPSDGSESNWKTDDVDDHTN